MGLLEGKVAIVTGGANGLGEAYCKLFAKEGAAVLVNDLGGARDGTGASAGPAQRVADAILAAGGRAVANGDDVSTVQGGESILASALDRTPLKPERAATNHLIDTTRNIGRLAAEKTARVF